jgi:hypothetical protein
MSLLDKFRKAYSPSEQKTIKPQSWVHKQMEIQQIIQLVPL